MQPEPGSAWGPFEVAEVLGRGATAVVYRARRLVGPEGGAPQGRVALKVPLAGHLLRDATALQRLEREARIAAGVQHPGIVRLVEAGRVGPLPYLALELVDGARPFDRAVAGRPLVEAVALLRDAALALGAAHARGVVHRDVKPANLLVGADGRLRVTDFGYAWVTGLARLTRTGQVLGTAGYVAPEVLLGGGPGATRPESDVWALAAVLFEVLTGAPPFAGFGPVELVEAARRGPPPLSERTAPAGLARLCRQALVFDPAARPADGGALAANLDAWLAEGPREPSRLARGPAPLAVSGSDEAREPVQSGATLGRYRLLELVGTGGMGRVFRARDPALRRDVAVKVLGDWVAGNPSARTRFRREAEAASRVRHPNLVSVHVVGEAGGVDYLVLDLVEGRPLDRVLAEERLEPERAARIALEVAQAVAALHAAGVLHRDLKPANVLIDAEGRARLTDFGVAKLLDVESLTQSQQVLGTPLYLAPEQLRGAPADEASDVFALGVLLFELLTGELPTRGMTYIELLAQKCQPPRAPSACRPGVDPALDAICLDCLAPSVARRTRSAAEVVADLEAYLAGGSQRSGVRRRSSPPAPRRAPLALAAAAALGLGVVALERAGPDASPILEARQRLETRLLVVDDLSALRAEELRAALLDGPTPEDPRAVQAAAEAWGWLGLAAAARGDATAAAEALAAAPAEEPVVIALRGLLAPPAADGRPLEALARLAATTPVRGLATLWARARADAGVEGEAAARAVLDELERFATTGRATGPAGRELEVRAAAALGDVARARRALAQLEDPSPLVVRSVALAEVAAALRDGDFAAGERLAEAPLPSWGTPSRQAQMLADELRARIAPLGGRLAEQVRLPAPEGRRLARGVETWARLLPGRPLPAEVRQRVELGWRRSGAVHRSSSDIAAACRRLEHLGAADAEASPVTWHARALVRLALSDNEGAVEACTRSLELDGARAAVWHDRALAQETLGRSRAALADLDRALALAPEELAPRTHRALLRVATRDLEGAFADAQRAVELHPQSARAWATRGTTRLRSRDVEGALGDFDRAVELGPELADVWRDRGYVRKLLGDEAGAEADYGRALEIEPDDVRVLVNRGSLRFERGDLRGALADFDRALAHHPDDPVALNNRGRVHGRLGDRRRARADFDRAIVADPLMVAAWCNRGILRCGADDLEGGVADLTHALELDPDQAEALGARCEYLARLGRVEEALADGARFLELAPEHTRAPHVRRLLEDLRRRR